MSRRLIAIETTNRAASIAAADDEGLRREVKLDPAERSGKTLAPALRALFDELGWPPKSIAIVAVDVGPGSFTGCRVGVTTAKTLAYAVGADCIALDCPTIIAAQAPRNVDELSVAIPAERGELFVTDVTHDAQRKLGPQAATSIEAADAWLKRLTPGTAVAGSGLEKLLDRLSSETRLLDDACWTPRARTLAELALARHAAGQREDLWKLTPLYLRRSAAEEQWERRKGAASN